MLVTEALLHRLARHRDYDRRRRAAMTPEQRHQQRERCQAARECILSSKRSDALSRRRENYAIWREIKTDEEREFRSANKFSSLYFFCNLVPLRAKSMR